MKTKIEIPVSAGELFDKITILRIKKSKGIEGVEKELELLENKIPKDINTIAQGYVTILSTINKLCWNVEDLKREYERQGKFDDDFIQTARCVYFFNDERARVKKQIDKLLGSEITEYKSHKEY